MPHSKQLEQVDLAKLSAMFQGLSDENAQVEALIESNRDTAQRARTQCNFASYDRGSSGTSIEP